MRYMQHEGDHLRFTVVEPVGFDRSESYPVVVLLHGFGAHMGDLAGLAPAIDSRSYVYAFPNAPIAMDMGTGTPHFAWAPLSGDGAEVALAHASRLIDGFLDEVTDMYRPPEGQVVLGGFSQGGMMAYRGGLARPGNIAGIASLSGFMGNRAVIEAALPIDRSQPIFAAHGTADDKVPVSVARGDMEMLRSLGYAPEYREYPIAHEVTQQVARDLSAWLSRVIGPASQERWR